MRASPPGDRITLMPPDAENEYLRSQLDANGDLAPPWEKFPSYERYTIGWRMGAGEEWLWAWHSFCEQLGPSYDARLAYLRRHPPAPVTWADAVHRVLHPSTDEEESEPPQDLDEDERERREEQINARRRDDLFRDGLIASDIAYSTWLSQQTGVRWPWEFADTPRTAARYWTRDLWFWSRQVDHLRQQPVWTVPALPERWHPCHAPLVTGVPASPDLDEGLLTLAQMLAAGRVTPPWQLGLTIADFADTFDDDMHYVDAFRLWGMSCIDDREQLLRWFPKDEMPQEWQRWMVEHFLFEW